MNYDELQILLPKGLWSTHQNVRDCMNFDRMQMNYEFHSKAAAGRANRHHGARMNTKTNVDRSQANNASVRHREGVGAQ